MKHFFIIGGSSLQRNFLHCVKKAGFISHVFDYDKNCVCKDEADFFHLISVDEKEQILALALKYQIAGIGTSASELGNITACYVGEKLPRHKLIPNSPKHNRQKQNERNFQTL